MEVEISQEAEKLKLKGNDFFKAKRYQEAIQQYGKAITYFSNRAACYLALNNHKDCIADCEEALKLDKTFIKAYLRKGKSLICLGQLDAAKQFMKLGLDATEQNAELKRQYDDCEHIISDCELFRQAMAASDFKKGCVYIKELIDQVPCNEELAEASIICAINAGEYKMAKDLIAKCLPSHQKGNYYTSLIKHYEGNEKGKQELQDLLGKCQANDPVGALNLCLERLEIIRQQEKFKAEGNAALGTNDYKRAIENFTVAIEADPYNKRFNAVLYSNRAVAWMKLDEKEKALTDLNLSISLDPNYWKSYLRRGTVHSQRGFYTEALNDFSKVKELCPEQNVDQFIKDVQEKQKKEPKRNYYDVLGVDHNASKKDISKAYHKLATRWHPDRHNQSDEAKMIASKHFREAAQAYSVLSDPKKRQQYDAGVDPESSSSNGPQVDPTQVFQMFFGGDGGMFGDHSQGTGTSGFTFSFGNRGGRRTGQSTRGADDTENIFKMFFGH